LRASRMPNRGGRLLRAVLIALVLLTGFPERILAHGLQPWQDRILVETSLRYDVWYWKLEETVHCESMHYDLAVIAGIKRGTAGEIGAVQLHPRGLLPLFYRLGFTDAGNFEQSVQFLAQMMADNPLIYLQRNWSCYPKRLNQ
jgi:hypothetical protein